MDNKESLQGQLLIAMPSMKDPNFREAVAYVVEHNQDGAMAIIINKPLDMTLNDIFEQLEIEVTDHEIAKSPVLMGGPIAQEQGFLIHPSLDKKLKGTITDINDITISASKEMLELFAQGDGSKDLIVTLGYAGWESGQLEEEMAQNAWLFAQATQQLLFHTPFTQRWQIAASSIGVDFKHLSGDIGHA